MGTSVCRCVLVALASLSIAACGTDESRLTILAASSLTDVLPDVAAAYEDASGVPIDLSFASSSSLREQILDGAPADVFVSASPAVIAELAQVELVVEPLDVIATNALVVVVPSSDAGEHRDALAVLSDEDGLVGACAVEVPCGELTQRVLAELDPDGNVVVETFEPNARATLAKVELGELDAAFVYRTDALSSDAVVLYELPDTATNSTAYVAGTIAGAAIEAGDFVDFLSTDNVQTILEDAGFGR